jgi:DNA-binding XRE family transcriptional regulator
MEGKPKGVITMTTTLEEKLAQLPKDRLERVEAKARHLIESEKALKQLRESLALTQTEVAERLEIAQEGISRIEQRQDLKLSTLRRYVEALGGKLNIVIEFPGRQSVSLAGLINANALLEESKDTE